MTKILLTLALFALPLIAKADLNDELQQRQRTAQARSAEEAAARCEDRKFAFNTQVYQIVRGAIRQYGGQAQGATCTVMPSKPGSCYPSYDSQSIPLASFVPGIQAQLVSCLVRIADNRICTLSTDWLNDVPGDMRRTLSASCIDEAGNRSSLARPVTKPKAVKHRRARE